MVPPDQDDRHRRINSYKWVEHGSSKFGHCEVRDKQIKLIRLHRQPVSIPCRYFIYVTVALELGAQCSESTRQVFHAVFIIQIFCGVAVDKCSWQFTNALIVAPFSTMPKL